MKASSKQPLLILAKLQLDVYILSCLLLEQHHIPFFSRGFFKGDNINKVSIVQQFFDKIPASGRGEIPSTGSGLVTLAVVYCEGFWQSAAVL